MLKATYLATYHYEGDTETPYSAIVHVDAHSKDIERDILELICNHCISVLPTTEDIFLDSYVEFSKVNVLSKNVDKGSQLHVTHHVRILQAYIQRMKLEDLQAFVEAMQQASYASAQLGKGSQLLAHQEIEKCVFNAINNVSEHDLFVIESILGDLPIWSVRHKNHVVPSTEHGTALQTS